MSQVLHSSSQNSVDGLEKGIFKFDDGTLGCGFEYHSFRIFWKKQRCRVLITTTTILHEGLETSICIGFFQCLSRVCSLAAAFNSRLILIQGDSFGEYFYLQLLQFFLENVAPNHGDIEIETFKKNLKIFLKFFPQEFENRVSK